VNELLDDNIGSKELIVALGVLGAAVVELYRRMASNVTRITGKLEKCEERHEKREVEMREMSSRIGHLEGEAEGVRGLAQQVLEIVAGLKK